MTAVIGLISLRCFCLVPALCALTHFNCWRGSSLFVQSDFSMQDVSLCSVLLLGQILGKRICLGLRDWLLQSQQLASDRIPQLFLFNSQTSEENRCKPQ